MVTAHLKALGVMAIFVLWVACFFVALLTPESSIVGWVALFLWASPPVVACIVLLGVGAFNIYKSLVWHFEGNGQ